MKIREPNKRVYIIPTSELLKNVTEFAIIEDGQFKVFTIENMEDLRNTKTYREADPERRKLYDIMIEAAIERRKKIQKRNNR